DGVGDRLLDRGAVGEAVLAGVAGEGAGHAAGVRGAVVPVLLLVDAVEDDQVLAQRLEGHHGGSELEVLLAAGGEPGARDHAVLVVHQEEPLGARGHGSARGHGVEEGERDGHAAGAAQEGPSRQGRLHGDTPWRKTKASLCTSASNRSRMLPSLKAPLSVSTVQASSLPT